MTHPVQAVRAAAFAQLKARVSSRKELVVRYGIPGEEAGARFVCVANGRHKSKPASLGRNMPVAATGVMASARDLVVEVDVVVQVRSTVDFSDVDAEAWALAEQVEDSIREDPTLGGNAWYCQVVEGDQAQSYETQNNIATIVLTLSANVRA